jgi:hypothetical protein
LATVDLANGRVTIIIREDEADTLHDVLRDLTSDYEFYEIEEDDVPILSDIQNGIATALHT